MPNLTFKRHLACLVIGSQLLGCGASAGSVAKDTHNWAPPVAPTPEPMFMRPNFHAPSATSCSGPIRAREIPAGGGQNSKLHKDGSPTVADSVAKLRGLISDKSAEGRFDSATSKAREEAGPEASMRGSTAMLEKNSVTKHSRAPAAAAADGVFATPEPTQSVPSPAAQRHRTDPVTAGVVDDNANFGDYLAFRARTQVENRPVDVAERYLLQVKDAAGRTPVPDAEVRIQAPSGSAMWARTDAGGQVWVSPNAFDNSRASTYQVSVRKPGRWGMVQATGFLQRGQKSAVEVTLDQTSSPRAQLDLVFLIDATGSMGDEIAKLKATVATIANEVARLPAKPDLCFGLVAYRDKGDEYLIRSQDFTNDLSAFQSALNQLQAGGGGDYPEAMNEALQETVHSLSWRGNGTTRMVFLIADAPPHLDYGGTQYDQSMVAALGKGIKLFSVGASGLDKQGEYIQRQIAQYTGGKFVFLTYEQASNPASGNGRETVHDVQNYGVDTLDRLIVRLVREDLAKLSKG